MRNSRFDERFRERLFAAQGEVPDRPGPEYEPAVEALVRARLVARYDAPPQNWRRIAAGELGRAERELAKLRAPCPAPTIVLTPMRGVVVLIVALACVGAAVALAAAVMATMVLVQITSGGTAPKHAHHHVISRQYSRSCDPELPACSGSAVNQNSTTGNVTVTVNS